MELRHAWLGGHFAPGSAQLANLGLGDPHLVLYPPVSLAGGGLLSMASLMAAPAVFVWFALLLAGVAMYQACEPFVAAEDRLAAAVLYMLSPYFVTSSLVRFAAADLLVQASLPLVVLQFYGMVWQRSRRATLLLGALLGLSWCTNTPMSLVLLYGLVTVAGLCAWRQRAVWPVLRFLVAEAVAGVLAAFYLLPLWYERAWINQTGLMRSDPQQWLLIMHRAAGGQETLKIFRYSCWLFAFAGFLLVLLCLWRRGGADDAARTWGYLASVSLFFQLPLAIPLWRYLPELKAAEFPFRFLPLLGVALPLALLAQGTPRRLRRPVYVAVGLMTLLPFFEHAKLQMTPSTRVPRFSSLVSGWESKGYEGLAEYWPVGVSTRASQPGRAPEVDTDKVATNCAIDCWVRVGIYGYPYWHASDEGSGLALATKNDADGILMVRVPAGSHRIRLEFSAWRRVRMIGAGISLAGILGMGFGIAHGRKRVYPLIA